MPRHHRLLRCSLVAAILINVFAIMATVATAQAGGYVCAEGGGNDRGGNWSPRVFNWMLEHGGNRKVIVLGASGTDARVCRTFRDLGAASVTYLAIDKKNADLPETAALIEAADIVWMVGGSQSRYVGNWNDTATEAAIRAVYDRGGVIGGTSAGCAVLGDVIYDAFNGSLNPADIIRDARHPDLSLTHDFLNLVPGVLFDTHFTERGRLPRLAVMLATEHQDHHRDLVGVGVDYRTALCINPDMSAEVRGEGAVTILHRTAETVESIAAGKPPLVSELVYHQLTDGYSYDLKNRQVTSVPRSAHVITNHMTPPQDLGGETLLGLNGADGWKGNWQLRAENDKSLYNGSMQCTTNTDGISHAVIATRCYGDRDMIENRFGGVSWILSGRPGAFGVLMDGGCLIHMRHAESHVSGLGRDDASAIFVSTIQVKSSAVSTFRTTRSATGPRQSVALENGRLHILPPKWSFQVDGSVHRRNAMGDLNADGTVNGDDIAIWMERVTSADTAVDVASEGMIHSGRHEAFDVIEFVRELVGLD